jgi:two-component system, OmpR family, sensor kinase
LKPLHPRRWPVRWRIASVSAVLTLLILLVFALVVGRLTTNRIRSDFRADLQSTANQLSVEMRQGGASATLREAVTTGNAVVRLVDAAGNAVAETPGAPDLGSPAPGEVVERGSYEVAAQALPKYTTQFGSAAYVQYARPDESVDSTISRLWLFLSIGVAGGSVLALLAGLAVAGRAMRPIASLTAAARNVAATRDPSQRIPKPETDDEVAELAETLEQMLRELDAARGETEQMVQAQRDFVADASHELRTPLTSILANLELLEARLAESGADPEELEVVAGALGSSRRMRSLVADLLLLARADAGRTGPRRRTDLREIAASALTEVKVMAAGHRIALHDGDPVEVDGDPNELHRLVVNLIENGVRHTPPGSSIDVTVALREGSAVLEVADDGPGLPEGADDQIFGRFVRGNGGPSDLVSDAGTGLGLAIVKAVANSHGGDVVASPSAAGGALFTVTLPASTEFLASVYTPS